MLRLASWNVNGIRACFKSGFLDWFNREGFDVVALQEVRALEDQIPPEILRLNGISAHWFAAEKKGYSGVGILSRKPPKRVIRGIGRPDFDVEGRVLTAEFEDFFVSSAYFPNSQDAGKRIDYKVAFCKELEIFLSELNKTKKPVLLTGDFNIALEDIDLARPDENHNTAGFLPREREWLGGFLKSGWVDTFRKFSPTARDRYSWWSARTRARERNIGWRIDYFTVPQFASERVKGADIQEAVLGSDHCPVTLSYDGQL
jgi:exodeoxyribonuclease-3